MMRAAPAADTGPPPLAGGSRTSSQTTPMRLRRPFLLLAVLLTLAVGGFSRHPERTDDAKLPERLSDRGFWGLVTELSEPDGTFRSDNLLSNEVFLQHVIPDLVQTAVSGRAYVGVGPEQNFTYIAAVRPRIAFIVDVRRGNLHLHLLYKALFELSADRVEFVARLFSKARPEGLTATSTTREIFDAFARVDASELLYKQYADDVRRHLQQGRRFPLGPDDLKGIDYVYYSFYWFGPVIQYWSSSGGRGARDAPSYADLMLADDGKGQARSYLTSEDHFRFVRELQRRNLIVPVVGNFAGPKAVRAVGRYLRRHDALVSVFYLSNVEQYLQREGRWYAFCGNVATLPIDRTSTFIRSVRNGMYGRGVGLDSVLANMAAEVAQCAAR